MSEELEWEMIDIFESGMFAFPIWEHTAARQIVKYLVKRGIILEELADVIEDNEADVKTWLNRGGKYMVGEWMLAWMNECHEDYYNQQRLLGDIDDEDDYRQRRYKDMEDTDSSKQFSSLFKRKDKRTTSTTKRLTNLSKLIEKHRIQNKLKLQQTTPDKKSSSKSVKRVDRFSIIKWPIIPKRKRTLSPQQINHSFSSSSKKPRSISTTAIVPLPLLLPQKKNISNPIKDDIPFADDEDNYDDDNLNTDERNLSKHRPMPASFINNTSSSTTSTTTKIQKTISTQTNFTCSCSISYYRGEIKTNIIYIETDAKFSKNLYKISNVYNRSSNIIWKINVENMTVTLTKIRENLKFYFLQNDWYRCSLTTIMNAVCRAITS